MTSGERNNEFLKRIKAPNVQERKVSSLIHSKVRAGTPLHMSPKPLTKLVDATHRLAKRNSFDFRKSAVQPKTVLKDAEIIKIYADYLKLPDGVSFYPPCPYVKKKRRDLGYSRDWFYDMDNEELPSALDVTPNDHAIPDITRPSWMPPNINPFIEPEVYYSEDMRPLDNMPSAYSNLSSFGMHGYGFNREWALAGPSNLVEREYNSGSSSLGSGRSYRPKPKIGDVNTWILDIPAPHIITKLHSDEYSYDS
jgi:hypothetical protein